MRKRGYAIIRTMATTTGRTGRFSSPLTPARIRSRSAVLLALPSLLAAGCTYGGGSFDGNGTRGGGSTLPGTVLVDDGANTRRHGVIYAIDPATGEVREHVTAFPDLADNTRYATGSSFLVGGAGDDGSLLLTVRNCVPPLGPDSCVERVGPDGSVERQFT